MKKILAILLAATMMFSLVACGETNSGSTEAPDVSTEQPTSSTDKGTESSTNTDDSDNDKEPPTSVNTPNTYTFEIDLDGIATLDDLETRIEEHLASSITSLASRWEALSVEIDTYDKYCDNSEKVSEFYQTVITETDQMCIMLYEYSAAYARMILDSDMSADDKYDAVDGINDCLYEDACDEIHDEIYEGILEDMNDYFYEGILDDAEDDVNYSDWYDVCSDEYNQWYDTSSEVYSLYYDAASEIYSFYYDMSSELYSRDFDRAEKVYEKFLQKIAKAKGIETGAPTGNATFDTTLRSASSIEELESVIDAHVSECVQALAKEWETLSTDIDTFEKYQANVGVIEEFHSHIEDSASQILVMICNYGASYADFILQSGSSTKDMYKAFEDFKDCIYEDACEYVKDDIYEDLLEEVKDYYYEGIINDAKDSVNYSDWSDARGDAYSWWSDARGEVYGEWSDTRGDLYSFYSDIRSELYSGDIDGANDELEDFRKKYSNGATAVSNVADSNEAVSNATEDTKKEAENSNSSNEIRPEFKEAMDSYEAFYTEYCEFMKKYSENPTDLTLLAKYADMLVKAEEMNEAFEEWDEDDLNSEELKYYLDVNNRVMKMLVDVAG